MLSTIKETFVNIDPEDVINKARKRQLPVHQTADFRELHHQYAEIEDLMEEYRNSLAKRSALSGLTTGIGGLTSAITFAGINTITLSVSLYRLAQRYAILNGFDKEDPLQKDKMMNIFFGTLGINAGMEAMLKSQFMKASAAAETGEASESLVLRLIMRSGRLIGKSMSAEEAGSLIPVVGGAVGAGFNYWFARRAAKKMKNAFKKAYFETWTAAHVS